MFIRRIDRTILGAINILMVSLIYDKRAMPIYWEILDKKGSSNLEEQQRVLEKTLTVLSGHKIVVVVDKWSLFESNLHLKIQNRILKSLPTYIVRWLLAQILTILPLNVYD